MPREGIKTGASSKPRANCPPTVNRSIIDTTSHPRPFLLYLIIILVVIIIRIIILIVIINEGVS